MTPRTSERPQDARLSVCRRIALAVALSPLGLLAVAAPAQTSDPAANYQTWRDDEIFAPVPLSGQLRGTSYEYDPGSSTLSAALPYCDPVPGPLQMAATAGRVMTPYADQVVVAHANGSAIDVRFADRCNTANPSVVTGPPATLGAVLGMPALAPPPVTGLPSWYDAAAGDLDRSADVDGNYRDEVVVAYIAQSSNPDLLEPIVAVLDYTANAAAPEVTWVKSGDGIYKWMFSVWSDHNAPTLPLSVVTGDFDGDGRKEIAIGYVRGWSGLGLVVLRYSTTEAGGNVTHSLEPLPPLVLGMGKPSDFTPDVYQGSIDTAAGDFDGDGKDELALAAIEFGYKSDDPRIAVDLKTFKADETLAMTQVSQAIPYEDGGTGHDFLSMVQLAAGLFKYAPNAADPTQDFGIDRRQLALATNGSSGAVDVRVLVYDTLLKPTIATSDAHLRIPASGSPPGRLSIQMAAGGFNGLQTTESPADAVWSLALSTWADNGQVLYLIDPEPGTGKIAAPKFSKTLSTVANTAKSTSLAPLVACDYGEQPTGTQTPGVLYGDSQYLGAPLYFRINDVFMTDYILQEPPKHVYWKIGNHPPVCPDKSVCNISAQDTFTLGTNETQSLGMSSEYHDTYDHSWGLSETVILGFTKGVGILPPSRSVTPSETVSYEFAEHTDDYNQNMTKRTVSLEHTATRDDAIKYRASGIDVWRYPVYGVELLDPDGNAMPYAYFDVTAPAPNDQTYLVGGIDVSDWYQPDHENGNILSYPSPIGGANRSYLPSDMGSFQVPCTDTTGKTCDHDDEGHPLSSLTVTGPLLDDPTGFVWSGTGQTFTLTDSRSETKGYTHTWSRTLKNSDDLKLTGRIPMGVKPGGWKFNWNIDVAFNGKWNWAGSHTMEMKSEDVNTLKLNVPAGVSSEAYNVYPSFYISDNGTTKVGFAVDMDTFSGKTYWEAEYYGQPDPALNLPLRFNANPLNNVVTEWTPNMLESRKLMRGFYVRRAELEDGEYPQYDGPPTVGDLVRLEARVYNYSLGQTVNPPGGLAVRFDYAPIDPATHDVQEDKRTVIGTTTVGPIGPRGMATAVVEWDTSQLDLAGALEQTFRVYVVLDPDNSVPNEKYETESAASRVYPIDECADPEDLPSTCIDPGQNNEGWREVILSADYAGDPNFGQPADVRLERDALAARDPNHPDVLLTNIVQVEEGQRLELRVRVDTDMPGKDYGHLLFYDGRPRRHGSDGKLFADKQASTGNPDGSYVWAEWTATRPGPHRLYAKLLESYDTQPGNAIDSIKVIVHKAKDKNKDNGWSKSRE